MLGIAILTCPHWCITPDAETIYPFVSFRDFSDVRRAQLPDWQDYGSEHTYLRQGVHPPICTDPTRFATNPVGQLVVPVILLLIRTPV